ncbi:MAG: serine/threonine-protein kinase, partial [Usitatibacteraceae bacterium]
MVERFLRERRLLARLTHPGIARLLDAGTYKNEPYLVMEYIDGEPITTWAVKHASKVTERVALMLKVCRAAEHAHGQLIVHRDLKPSNVLVRISGEPSLLDFGIAKLIDDEDDDYGTALTRMTGRGFTLGYCAPEQITGEPTGVAADVFSMGVLLFELLTGALPFKSEPGREGRAALEHAIVHNDARSLGRALDEAPAASVRLRPVDASKARGDLDAIVAKALRKNPADRYSTLSALADDLEKWMSNLPVHARRGNWQYMTMLWLKRNRALAIVGTAAFIAVSAGMVAAIWQADRANEEALRADQEKEAAVEQRRRAEIATAQATAALAESDRAKSAALEAERQADRNAVLARQSASAAAASSKSAQTETSKAKAVNQYLVTLFESADPEHTKGEKLTAREVLDTGTKSLSVQFANDPDTLAQLQGALGRSYVGLSQPQTAIPLLTTAVAHAARRYGPQSVEHARLEFSLARAQLETENFPAAEKHYRTSMAVLEPLDGLASEAIVQGKVNLAYSLQKQGKYAEVEPLILPVRAAIISQRGEKDWLFAEIENSRAVLYSAQG